MAITDQLLARVLSMIGELLQAAISQAERDPKLYETDLILRIKVVVVNGQQTKRLCYCTAKEFAEQLQIGK